MFCKNCGNEITDEALFCNKCGFRAGDGEKHCSHCGVSVQKGQSLCVSCGFMLTTESLFQNKKSEKAKTNHNENAYKKYVYSIKKIKSVSLIIKILFLVLFVSLIFLPIFKYSFEPDSLDEVKDLSEFEELLVNGGIEKNFSIWDDITIRLKGLSDDGSDSVENLGGIMAIFEVAFGLVSICSLVVYIIDCISKFNEIDKTALLVYTEIKKMGNEIANKLYIFVAIIVFFTFMLTFVDLFCCMLFTEVALDFQKKEFYRHMMSLTGVSAWLAIVVVLVVVLMVLATIHDKYYKDLNLRIAKEELESDD